MNCCNERVKYQEIWTPVLIIGRDATNHERGPEGYLKPEKLP